MQQNPESDEWTNFKCHSYTELRRNIKRKRKNLAYIVTVALLNTMEKKKLNYLL